MALSHLQPEISFRSEEEANNTKRCQQILECKQQIVFWRFMLAGLEEEQTQCIKLARLRLDAETTWRLLNDDEKISKRFVMAAMESEGGLPEELRSFPSSRHLPWNLRNDRDIVLARIARSDFDPNNKRSDGGDDDDDDETDRFFLPRRHRCDKEIVMKLLPKYPAVLECISMDLRDDDDVFHALLNSVTGPMPDLVLQYFSDRIRSEPSMILDLCSQENGISSLGLISPHLKNDKSFLLEVIEAMEDCCCTDDSDGDAHSHHLILKHASQRLQDDDDVVLAAVKKCGCNLKYASYALRRNDSIVRAAVEQNGAAVRYCLPGDTKDALLSDRDFVLHRILPHAPTQTTLKLCVDRYPDDEEVWTEALGSGIEWSLVPSKLQTSTDFLKRTLLKRPRTYLNLPEWLQNDLASTVIESDTVDDDVLVKALSECPSLLMIRNTAVTIATKCTRTRDILVYLQFCCFRNDKEIMLKFLRNDRTGHVHKLLHQALLMDRDVLLAIVQRFPCDVHLPHFVQREHPEIVIQAIRSCDRRQNLALYDFIYGELWSNREVVMAWISRFGEWLPEDFPEEYKDDEELWLALVKSRWSEFQHCSTRLRSNKEFLCKVINVDARVVRDIEDDDLRHDDDLVLRAVSQDRRAIQFYSQGRDFEYMVSFTEQVRRRLADYDAFVDGFVESVVRPTQNPHSCCLSLLNQGPDAVRYHSNLIASYLGLPDSEELLMLRAASANLLHWGF